MIVKMVNVKGGVCCMCRRKDKCIQNICRMERDQYGRSRRRWEYKINQERQGTVKVTQMRFREAIVAVKGE
jgi:hypothetical protein